MSNNVPIRVIDPLTPAYHHMKAVLFRPFDIGRWFAIGFCAWLATLGQGGVGGGPNFAGTPNQVKKAPDQWSHAKQWVVDNLNWLIPVAIVVVVLGVALWVVLVWLSSRGQFMLMHCVVTNRAEVRVPWSTYAALGNNLCKFRLIFCVAATAVMVLPGVLLAVLIYAMVSNQEASSGRVLAATLLGLMMILLGLVLAAVLKLTRDFVVPVMALRQGKCLAAWREVAGLLQTHPGAFILYLLLSFLLTIAIGFMIVCLTIVTCCIAGVLLAIPYLGTVLLLPVIVFVRAYSLYFLAQFGPQFSVFAPPPTTSSGT